MIALCREFGCRVHIVHLSSADALPMIAPGPRGGVAADRRDVSALPHVRRRGDPRWRHSVSSGASDPRTSESRAALGGPPGGSDRHDRHGPLARTPRAQAPGHRRPSRAWGGIASLQLRFRPSGPRRAGAGSRSTTWRDGWPVAPPSWSGSRAERGDRPGPRRRPRRLRPRCGRSRGPGEHSTTDIGPLPTKAAS